MPITDDYWSAALDDGLVQAIAVAAPAFSDTEDPAAEAYLDLLAVTAEAHRRTGAMLQSTALAARSAGLSWQAIGQKLGISRQAAQQRFGGTAGTEAVPGEKTQTRVLSQLSAFNEMQVLARAGQYGWHSIAYGPFHHVLQKDRRQWQHRRLLAWTHRPKNLKKRGWTPVGSGWFPWVYYARPLDRSALQGEITDEELLAE